MNLAKVSSNGQITVPIEIRRKLGLKSGDKMLFIVKANGEIVVANASQQAIYHAQQAFKGANKELGLYNEDDVQKIVDEIRYSK